jgi:hypothetical protein
VADRSISVQLACRPAQELLPKTYSTVDHVSPLSYSMVCSCFLFFEDYFGLRLHSMARTARCSKRRMLDVILLRDTACASIRLNSTVSSGRHVRHSETFGVSRDRTNIFMQVPRVTQSMSSQPRDTGPGDEAPSADPMISGSHWLHRCEALAFQQSTRYLPGPRLFFSSSFPWISYSLMDLSRQTPPHGQVVMT